MTDTNSIETKTKALALSLKAKVDALVVEDQESYDIANRLQETATASKTAFHAWYDPIDDASKAQRKTVIAQGKAVDEPLDYIIYNTGLKAGTWLRAEEARTRARQAEADAAAKKRAEDSALDQAQMLADMGLDEAAEDVISSPVVSERVRVAGPEKGSGTILRDYYSAEVTDLMALVKAVAAGEVPLAAIEAGMTYLNGMARTLKGNFKIPGCKVVMESKQGRRS